MNVLDINVNRRTLLRTASIVALSAAIPPALSSAEIRGVSGVIHVRNLFPRLPNLSGSRISGRAGEISRVIETITAYTGSESDFQALVRDMIRDDYRTGALLRCGQYVLTSTEAAVQTVVNKV